ncbi:fluoride efflux transporter FluC [Rudaeicoccus suwonensis]|uniref:Fluoride-specific ion channel FluC n=1 Tax=Rudaeicoccus suwonensis TaxID=657409 RepID=A0A561E6N3_9MICO|nr:CrcB family protein [Rudaeicoccus suwonensis]TWE11261.1 CrcB protein [Rudaeicoccus suwonensis]
MRSRDFSKLPLDPDVDVVSRPLHLRWRAVAVVFVGGFFGTAARDLLQKAYPHHDGGIPWATFAINVGGGFILGLLLESLLRAGPDDGWRRRLRLLAGTGFCGAFTTYSSLASDTNTLLLASRPGNAIVYSVGSVAVGIVSTWCGIRIAALLPAASRGEVA